MLQMFCRGGTPGVGTPSMTGFIASYRHKLAHGTLRPLTRWERIVNALLAEAATERELNEFQASLVEPAGAVRVARQRADGAEALVVPPFIPDPACHQAVETGVLRPGSDADRAVEDVVADFTREDHRPDPTHVEFG
jgi:hypothetical protein